MLEEIEKSLPLCKVCRRERLSGVQPINFENLMGIEISLPCVREGG